MSKGTRYFLALVLSLVSLGGFGLRLASAQSYVFNVNTFATGTSPEAIVSGDFNGDGQPDVAVVDYGANTISVLLGNKNATLQACPQSNTTCTYAVGHNPIAIVAADFNGDGKLDLAVVNSSDNSVSVLLGNGDGTFQNQAVNTVGTNPDSIAAADLRGDGKVDLVVVNNFSNTVSVLLGNGDGTFQPQVAYDTGTGPASVGIADFNGDGKLDLVTADKSINSVSILLGNGDGTVQACVASDTSCTYGTGRAPVQVVVGDFNNDGQPDLAVADGGDGAVTILPNNKGTFKTQVSATTFTICSSLVAGDFNGDHNLDLAVSSAHSDTVVILLGRGDGQFDTEVKYATGGLSGESQNPIVAADFNGDGHLDLAVANPLDSTVSVLLNNGSGVFSTTATDTAVDNSPISLAVADFNGDGNLDAATVSYTLGSGSVSVLLGNGDGTFKAHVDYPVGVDPEFVAVGDFNGDGFPDLAVAEHGDAKVSILLNKGDGTFDAFVPYSTGNDPDAIAVGDFNGDGKLDLAVGNASAGTVSILLGNGDGTFQLNKDYSAGTGTNPSWVATADLNGDGILDLAVADTYNALIPGVKQATGTDQVTVMLGKGDGSFPTNVEYSTGTGSAPAAVVIGDFNGDGTLDLATANHGTGGGSVSVLLNIGSGTFGPSVQYPAGAVAYGIATADLNGDGKLDLAVGTTSSFTDSIATLVGNGNGTFQPEVEHGTGYGSPNRRQPVVLADFNNDKNIDAAVTDEINTSSVAVYLSQPEIAFSPGTLSFPGQLVGTSSQAQTLTVSNPGNTPLSLTSIASSGDFAQTNTCPTASTLAVGASCTASLTFTPSAAGTRTGNLTVTDDVPDSPQTYALSGTGDAPTVTLAPTSLTFAAQNIGTTSAAQNVTLTNTGTGTLTITSIAASAQYAETNTCNGSVAEGASCTVSVTFTPTKPGTQTGTITFTDNATGSPQTLALTGTGNGPSASLAPADVTFSAQPVGSASPIQTVTLTNTGNQSLSITSISTKAPFTETNNCAGALAPNASCTISVDFAPTASGAVSGSLTVTDNASGSPQTVPLSGTGSTGGYASLSPAAGLTFQSTPVGGSAAPQIITLSNTGNATLSITSIAVTGTNSGDFSETNTCGKLPASLLSGKNCTISVTFKPAAAGNRSGAITVTSNGAGSPQSVALTGTGSTEPTVTLSPTSLDFGSQLIGSKTTKTITLTNAGNATLSVTSIAANGSGYSETNSCGTSVNAGAVCTITVTFAPPAGSQTLTGTVVITDNAPGSPQTVSLSGSGTGPAATLAPNALSFPGQSVKSTSKAQTVTVTNGGTSALSITNVTVTGAAASEFAATSACGSSVAVGASCTISVTFSPTSDGNQSASLTITDNAANGAQTVSLSGGGADFSVAAATSSQSVSAGQSGIYSVSLTPTGGFNQTVNLTCSASIPAGTCSVSQPSLTLNNGPITVTVTATTTAGAALPPAPRTPTGPGPWLWLVVMSVFGLGATLLGRRRRTSWVLAAALALVTVWAACGGGSSSSSTAPSSTPSGTYSLSVTASAGTLSNKASLTLVVH